MDTLPYVIVALGASFLGIAAATYFTSLHREARNKVTFLIILGSVLWLLMSTLAVSSDNVSVKLFFSKIQFVGVFMIPATWLIQTMQLSGYERWIKRRNVVMLGIVPTITLLLISTNEFHHLIWSNLTLNAVNPFLPLNETRAVGYWLFIVGYSWVVLMFALAILVRRVIGSRNLYRRQAIPAIFACCVPWLLGVVWFLNPSIFMYIDPMPLALTVASSIFVWRLAYSPGADVVPVAHELIFDSMNDAVVILDAQTRIVELNPAAEQLVGHNLSDAIGMPVEEMWAIWLNVKKELDSGTERVREASFGAGGEKKVYEIQSSYLSGITSERPNLLIILRDITERKEMEQRLLKAEHLAAIGETASMVAHDLRNPLQSITGAAYVLRGEAVTADERNEMLHLIESSVEYAEATVRDLLDYSREIHLQRVELPPKAIIQCALQPIKIPDNVKVHDISREQPAISVDPDRMKRVFINLIENAIDAMPSGGTLTVDSKESNGHVEITVSDTGTGVPENIMENLWKPLQTTKVKGMGLGLPIVKRIVDAHRGEISVETRPGEGTTFTIRLPIKVANLTSIIQAG